MGTKDVKSPKPRVEADEPLPYGLRELILFPTWLTIITAACTFAIALVQGGPEVFTLAAGFVVGLAVIYYGCTFVIGGLGLIPAALGRLQGPLDRARKRRRTEPARLWDDWLDRP